MGIVQSFDESAKPNRHGLVARCVSLSIGDKSLLKGLSLQVRPGEVLAVVGPNGAGKSTLLKVLSGEYRADFGSISLNGKELRDIPLKELAHHRAVLPQETQLSFPFRAEEVVAMGRSPHRKMDHRSDEHVVRQAMDVAGVRHLFGRNYTTLSGGERQRVQLARVLAQVWEAGEEPRYLLLDEPTSALDLAHQHKVLETATDFARRSNMGVLAVLHDLNLAAYYADRIAILKNGYLLCCGAPTEVLTTDRIEEAFELSAVVLEHPQCENCPLVVASVA